MTFQKLALFPFSGKEVPNQLVEKGGRKMYITQEKWKKLLRMARNR
jgi:hypothetical protein